MSSSNIVVTGFGPFGEHAVNASWESVKLLPDEIDGHKVVKEEIVVSYDFVDGKIQALWKEHNPELMVHVGVSSFTSKITLESCAYKQGYIRKDIHGNFPKNGVECTAACADHCIPVSFSVEEICSHLNNTTSIQACVSKDAGRYLCEYTLYSSLSVDKNKALFIHVPPLDKPYTAQELAEGIQEVIRCALKQRKRI